MTHWKWSKAKGLVSISVMLLFVPVAMIPKLSKSPQFTVSDSGLVSNSSDPVEITSDADFVALGFDGSGTVQDPYVIQSICGHNGISISNTRDHFVITDSIIWNYVDQNTGISLNNISHGVIRNVVIRGKDTGIDVAESSDFMITNTTIDHCQNGMRFSSTRNGLVSYNEVYANHRGVFILESNATLLNWNTIVHNGEYGVVVVGENNTLYGNRIGWNRALNARDSGNFTKWDDEESIGNYWSDLQGQGPYNITGNTDRVESFDNFPELLEG
ncbi:MAG: NosD domain-containing protein, partial [Candidatus Thorarchaeota archaeon]